MKYPHLFRPSLRLFSTTVNPKLHEFIKRLHANDQTLGACYINTTKLDAVSVRDLCRAIGQSKQLETVALEGANIGDAGALEIARCVRLNPRLRDLTLFNIGISNKGGVAIAKAISETDGLKKLEINHNILDTATAEEFTRALSWVTGNNSITGVSFTKIGTAAAQQIVPLFKTRPNLTTLEFAENQINDHDALEVAEAIKANSNLCYLDLCNNNISEVGAEAILKALQASKRNYPMVLNLMGNNIAKGPTTKHRPS